MAQLNLSVPYATINFVKVNSIYVNPLQQKVYAAVYYYFSKDNVDRAVEAVRYSTTGGTNTEFVEIPNTVILTGADYTSYTQYVSAGRTPDAAVLQVLVDRNVLSGTIV